MYRIILVATLFLMCVTTASSQVTKVASVVHSQYAIKSQAVGEDRTFLVRLPVNYERSQTRYPVIYMLDAHPPQPAMMAGMLEQQVWGDVMSDAIIVGIQNTNRVRDMTPTPGDRAGAGGAEKFLRFIETELIPFVDKNFRTEPHRTIAGHSLAGLFVVYALTERPDAFNAYIAASPYLHWDNNYLVERAEASFKKRSEWNKTLFIGLGDEPEYMNAYNAFQQQSNGRKRRIWNTSFGFSRAKIIALSCCRRTTPGYERSMPGGRYPLTVPSRILRIITANSRSATAIRSRRPRFL